MNGVKHDNEKAAMALLPPRALEQVAKAMGHGATKYGAHNYLGGIVYSRLISALLRHTFQYLKGEDCDVESGLPHWAHIGANVLMLGEMTFGCPEMDDRYKVKPDCRHSILSYTGRTPTPPFTCSTCGKVFSNESRPKCDHKNTSRYHWGTYIGCGACGEKL
jgi:hypothetical protein